MLDIDQTIAKELKLAPAQVARTLALFAEGGTVPFVARYRKERTGGLDEVALRKLEERHAYLTELEERKTVVLQTIADQGVLTDALRERITACTNKTELEDLYLPYKPKKRTRATVARERGLEPLADWIHSQNKPHVSETDLEAEAGKYVDPEKGIETPRDALDAAADILAEAVAERAEHRAYLRGFVARHGAFCSKLKQDQPPGDSKYAMYHDYRAPVKTIQAHNLLALMRGEREGALSLSIELDEAAVLTYLTSRELNTKAETVRAFYQRMLKDAWTRLLKPSITGEVQKQKKAEADAASIETFAANLRELLLASPAGAKPTLGVDPGFRTGCKLAVVDGTGKLLDHRTIYPHTGEEQREQAQTALLETVQAHGVQLVAIGNGTAGRETDQFVAEALADLDDPPVKVLVNEAGASVYSASEVAIREFPELDLTVRGAISIARRLQDPLAELVKIDPKSIGVGQYQHDVDQKQLKGKLDVTVESCVNHVGVDLNTASRELLSYVAGLAPGTAERVVRHRDEHGPFRSRQALLEVPRFGPKTFEQASGFLRIRDGDNPLDNTAVHPERYGLVETMARDLGITVEQIARDPSLLDGLDLGRYVSDDVGEPTLHDILDELKKPGRDPRAAFRAPRFNPDVNDLEDLQEGMALEGVVTNVTDFGAFVDVGVHQDGLVHISQLADRFVKDPKQVVKVGQIVRVRVLEVDPARRRIGLSLRSPDAARPRR